MVEAAVFIPIFLAAVLTLMYFNRVLAIQETAVHILCDEARSFSSVTGVIHEAERSGETESTLAKRLQSGIQLASQWSFSESCSRRMKEEWGESVASSSISEFQKEISEYGMNDLIRTKLDYRLYVPIPLSPVRRVSGSESLIFRPFIGVSGKLPGMSFEVMEREDDSALVWVFPRAGERYHVKTCGVVSVDPEERILNVAIRQRYASCSLCNPQSMLDGSPVYCFSRSGKVYHRKNCASVTRYVVSMERTEAEQEGYTPCLKCGGGVKKKVEN